MIWTDHKLIFKNHINYTVRAQKYCTGTPEVTLLLEWNMASCRSLHCLLEQKPSAFLNLSILTNAREAFQTKVSSWRKETLLKFSATCIQGVISITCL